MSVADLAAAPILVAPTPPRKRLSLLKFLRVNAEQGMPATIEQAGYEQLIVEHKTPFGRNFLVSDPAGVKQILLDNVANYPKTEMERRAFAAAFGDGLLSSDGSIWRAHRRIMAPGFDPRSLQAYAPSMTEASIELVGDWDRSADHSVVDIHQAMLHLALRIISRTMFSAGGDRMGELVARTTNDGFEALGFGLADLIPLVRDLRIRDRDRRMARIFSELDVSIHRLIEERVQSADAGPKDLLGRLIAARDTETGAALTRDEIRDQVVTIFIAGHETTAVAMAWIWYLLSQHPAEEAKLHAELARVLGGRAPGHADLAALPYTRMVVEESMRLYPPAPALSTRAVLADDVICGTRVPRGSTVDVMPWVIHRHHGLWDRPLHFDPERFSPARSAGRPRFAYLPFGGGPRVCIGAALAMTETMLILASIAQHYRLRLAPDENLALKHLVTLRPRNGMRMIVERREDRVLPV
jgi:cytochrome P450